LLWDLGSISEREEGLEQLLPQLTMVRVTGHERINTATRMGHQAAARVERMTAVWGAWQQWYPECRATERTRWGGKCIAAISSSRCCSGIDIRGAGKCEESERVERLDEGARRGQG